MSFSFSISLLDSSSKWQIGLSEVPSTRMQRGLDPGLDVHVQFPSADLNLSGVDLECDVDLRIGLDEA